MSKKKVPGTLKKSDALPNFLQAAFIIEPTLVDPAVTDTVDVVFRNELGIVDFALKSDESAPKPKPVTSL